MTCAVYVMYFPSYRYVCMGSVSTCKTVPFMLHTENMHNRDNSKSVNARVMHRKYDISLYHTLSIDDA